MARRCFFWGGEEGCSLCFGNSVLCCLPKPSNEREGSRRMQLGGGRASLSICHDDMAVLSEFFRGGGGRNAILAASSLWAIAKQTLTEPARSSSKCRSKNELLPVCLQVMHYIHESSFVLAALQQQHSPAGHRDVAGMLCPALDGSPRKTPIRTTSCCPTGGLDKVRWAVGFAAVCCHHCHGCVAP